MSAAEHGPQHPFIDKKDEKTMKAMKYRKKPVEIEAMQWTGAPGEAPEIIRWIVENGAEAEYVRVGENHPSRYNREFHEVSDADVTMVINRDAPAFLAIRTLEGLMRADVGDWVIKGVQGEFYPCKPDIFEKTYQTGDAL